MIGTCRRSLQKHHTVHINMLEQMRTSSLSWVMALRTLAMERELMYTLSPHLYAHLLSMHLTGSNRDKYS